MHPWCLLGTVLFATFTSAYAEGDASLVLTRTFPMPGAEGRIDHMAVDITAGRLYVAALGNNSVEMIDLKQAQVVASIKEPREPQGIAVLPDSHALVVASGADGTCRVYEQSLRLRGALTGLDDADNVRIDTGGHVWVGYGSGALAVIDPAVPALIRETKLNGHPESFQMERDGARVFVNVPSADEVTVVDKLHGSIVGHWPLHKAKANFPMALDEKDHRLFVGCREPAKLLVLDTETGNLVAEVDCSGDADDVFYDDVRKRIYVSGGEGRVTVIKQVDADRYECVGWIRTASGARAALFVPASGLLYVAVPHRGAQQAEIREFKARP